MRLIPLFLLVALLAPAETAHPTGSRITPPTLRDISPRGLARGATTELTVEGFNLAGANKVFFSEPGVTGRILRVKELPDLPDIRLGSNGTQSTIDLGPLPPRNQVTLEIEVDPEAPIGPVGFRLLTPLGTSPEGTLLVEPYYGESPDKEPNDAIEGAFESYLPSILAGAISRPGDVDHFKITVKAGTLLSFENSAMAVGSSLQPVVAILDEQGNVLAEYGLDGGSETTAFAHKFAKDGVHYVRVTDYEKSGRGSHTYRIKVGEFPLVTSAFPLGLQRASKSELQLAGYNLGINKITATGTPSKEDPNALLLRPQTPEGPAFNRIKLALGNEPETISSGTNRKPASALAVQVPVTINGRIEAPVNGVPVENYFRFKARKGQQLVFDVNARRLGSELDSFLEVLDANAKPIEQAVLRPTVETFTVLRDHDSAQPGIRISHWNNINVGDYMLLGREVVRVSALPRTPDEDIRYEAFGSQRRTFFNTSPEAHAIDKAVYKVQINPPGTQLPPNGLPLTRLYAQNDDGGPMHGKDSYLTFTAPADAEYLVRIRDIQGLGGDKFPYRLTIREPRADFQLSVSPQNPNVPRGGAIPLTFTASRFDGFEGPIDVSLKNLPAGLSATKATILPGQSSAVVILSAAESASLADPVPLEAEGVAGNLVRAANPEESLKLIALAPLPDITMTSETKSVALAPGQTASVTVRIKRNNGFAGRVPVDVLNLPPRTLLPSFGLNGVLLNEDESERTFEIAATPQAEPVEQYIVVGGRVETRSTQQNTYTAPLPILVKIQPIHSPGSESKNKTSLSAEK